MNVLSSAAALADLAGEILGRVVSRPTCAACDTYGTGRAVFCGACAATLERTDLAEAKTVAPFTYGGALAQAITRFKYAGRYDLARPLADLLWRAVQPRASALSGARVVPVPLHPSRLAERGYNQAALLGGRLARRLGSPFAPLALSRTRDTPRQASLGKADRLVNLAGAFVVRRPGQIRHAHVLLVDDVMTTGATLRACEAALLLHGAQSVRCCVLARAP